jgi:hypothetical protein
MKNKHQNPSFKFQTNIAEYNAQYCDQDAAHANWVVGVIYNSTEKIRCTFELPITWSRGIVFRFLSDMECNGIGRD